jgi:hypothetical protein
MNTGKFNIGSGAIMRYASLDYDPWYAFAEFVDNSIHNYLLYKLELNRLNTKKLTVKISLNDGKSITIWDNAGGVNPDDHSRLWSFGVSKEKNPAQAQLSEFGMGMKTSAFWFGSRLEIETKFFKSIENDTFKFVADLDNIGQEEEFSMRKVHSSSNYDGYTKVTISKLNRILTKKKSREKIISALENIYRKYIGDGTLELWFEDVQLKTDDFVLLKDSGGNELKHKFEITLKSGKKCFGWIGQLSKGNSTFGGFQVYRHKRLVMGYPENSWYPSEIFNQEGGSNTLIKQRLIGELDMTEFDVAHTKNKIIFNQEDEEEFRERLRVECAPIRQNAQDYRKKGDLDVVSYHNEKQTIIDQQDTKDFIERINTNPINYHIDTINFTNPITKSIVLQKIDNILENPNNLWLEHPLKNVSGFRRDVRIYDFIDSELPYMITKETDEILHIGINLGHDYTKDLPDVLLRQFRISCMFDALSELQCKNSFNGEFQVEDIRLAKDQLLKDWADFLYNEL